MAITYPPQRGTDAWQKAPKPESVAKDLGTDKPVATVDSKVYVTDLRVSEIVSAFLQALERLDAVTNRINVLCTNADSELDK